MTRLVLLTGATGFVGRQVLNALSDEGKKVRVIVREGKADALAKNHCVESIVVTKDLFAEDANWWEKVCRGIDTVIHVAWYAEPGQYLQSSKNLDCLIGTLELAKGLTQAKVKRFIGIGTCFEYDLTIGRLTSDSPLKPLTPYAAAKSAAYLMLSQYFLSMGIEFAWGRLFYLYGEGEDPRRLVPYLRSKLSSGQIAELTSGQQIRDFMDVREAGQMIVQIALSDLKGPTNICSGMGITVKELAEKIADEYGRKDLLKFGARPDNLIDPPFVIGVR